jgi:hypothetical protein
LEICADTSGGLVQTVGVRGLLKIALKKS